MLRILMGGLPDELADRLQCHLEGVCLSAASNKNEILEELCRGDISLLVLDHERLGVSTLDLLEEIRRQPQGKSLPVICCLNEGAGSDLTKKLVKELGVSEVLLAPLDTDELARQAARILGLPFSVAEGDREKEIDAAVADVRSRFMGAILERIETLERAGVALLEENLRPELRAEAEREAHKLAGLLGTLGFSAGSRFAREIEKMLQEGTDSIPAKALRFSELVVALRLDVEKAPAAPGTGVPPPEKKFSLLIVDRDRELAERLEAEAASRDLQVQTAADLSAARETASAGIPDVALLDLSFSGHDEEGLALLTDLSSRTPPVPVMVLTSRNNFTDRVEVARRGGRGFISKSASASQILDAVAKLTDRLHATKARIMAVDDDPQVLALLRALLEPRNVLIATLDDPLQFWDRLEAFSPDLLLLDVDMPHLSGIELCRVLRNDARWVEVPVIFLTRRNDAGTIQRVFSAGADDFVAKPIVGPELLTRIFNRLERVRLRKNLSDTDPLTGVLNRRKSSQMLADFLELAKKHGQPFSLAILDVKHLRKINEEHGHAAGDAVMQRIGHLLQKAFRSEDVLARWSGDEFVAGMYGLNRYDGVERLTELVEKLRKEVFQAPGGAAFHAVLNGGVAGYAEDGGSVEALYRSAEQAAAQARSAGGGKVVPVGWSPSGAEGLKTLDAALVMRDEAQASLLLHSLESRGYRARWLPDGKTAEKMLSGSRPPLHSKVLVLDVDLPRLDGLSLLKKLAWDGVLREARVIMLTAPSVANEAQVALELGAFDYVAKPFNPPVVVQHIRRALDSWNL